MKTFSMLRSYLVSSLLCVHAVVGQEAHDRSSFLQAKTLFQTNRAYDPRIAMAVDGVIVHRHGASDDAVRDVIQSWKQHGYTVGRMFFADSDAENIYWKGRWDGAAHPDDVERDAEGKVVKCSGVRPYMLPTEGWIKYLEEMTVRSIDAGADAILPEEPLAHVYTGYEKSFRKLWEERYGTAWQPESASEEARFLTAQLKNELYMKLVRRLATVTQTRAGERGRTVDYILPVHALYSNVAARLVAPLGTSLGMDAIDGYIGQVWTGPVNWTLSHYSAKDKSFFASAYALYDYFVSLTVGSGKKLWLLADPVADNPHYTWAEFENWYQHCLVAKLFFPETDAFEVMPWPERVFVPGFRMGGGTPAPESFRIKLLSAIQVLQEMPADGQWCAEAGLIPPAQRTGRVGVAISDTVMWEKHRVPRLDGVYGLLMPLIQEGMPVSACLNERCYDANYLSRFDVIVLCYEAWKPLSADMNRCLVNWVERGGSLIVLGEGDDLGGANLWWKELGYVSPLHHLLAMFRMPVSEEVDQRVGKGWVYRRVVSPTGFTDREVVRKAYWPIVQAAFTKAGFSGEPLTRGKFCMRRGPFVVTHTFIESMRLTGQLINILDPDLPLLDGVTLPAGSSGLFRDVSALVGRAVGDAQRPCVLHATHRLISDDFGDNLSRVTIRGPAETPAVIRLYCAGKTVKHLAAHDLVGNALDIVSTQDGRTLKLQVPNRPDGVVVEVGWSH